MNEVRTRYTNAYTARLHSGAKPLPGRTVKFRVQKDYPEGTKPQELSRKTAADGTARLAISEIYRDIDEEVDIFTGRYTVQASFEPSGGDNVSPAQSPSLVVYPLSAEKARAHAYPLFTFEHRLYVTPETQKNFPEIAEFVRRLRDRKQFTAGDVKQALKLSDSRAGELVGFLVSSRLLRVVAGSRFEWRTTLSAGSSVQLLTVEDDFN